jgi:hypothetical protein
MDFDSDRPLDFRQFIQYFRGVQAVTGMLDARKDAPVSVQIKKGRLNVVTEQGHHIRMIVRYCDQCPPGKRMVCPSYQDPDADLSGVASRGEDEHAFENVVTEPSEQGTEHPPFPCGCDGSGSGD